ncbi:unnamed protein product [Pieris brassicae]|uniref:Uncharacterized protein n=1 Tax=Pieris brassicae TaxID=7116 RepID=A0A9P0X7F8_PIEBR|nr:unnamed protein product [Pieris brassicae]
MSKTYKLTAELDTEATIAKKKGSAFKPYSDRKTNIPSRSENRTRRHHGAHIHTPADVTINCNADTHNTPQKTTS